MTSSRNILMADRFILKGRAASDMNLVTTGLSEGGQEVNERIEGDRESDWQQCTILGHSQSRSFIIIHQTMNKFK